MKNLFKVMSVLSPMIITSMFSVSAIATETKLVIQDNTQTVTDSNTTKKKNNRIFSEIAIPTEIVLTTGAITESSEKQTPNNTAEEIIIEEDTSVIEEEVAAKKEIVIPNDPFSSDIYVAKKFDASKEAQLLRELGLDPSKTNKAVVLSFVETEELPLDTAIDLGDIEEESTDIQQTSAALLNSAEQESLSSKDIEVITDNIDETVINIEGLETEVEEIEKIAPDSEKVIALKKELKESKTELIKAKAALGKSEKKITVLQDNYATLNTAYCEQNTRIESLENSFNAKTTGIQDLVAMMIQQNQMMMNMMSINYNSASNGPDFRSRYTTNPGLYELEYRRAGESRLSLMDMFSAKSMGGNIINNYGNFYQGTAQAPGQGNTTQSSDGFTYPDSSYKMPLASAYYNTNERILDEIKFTTPIDFSRIDQRIPFSPVVEREVSQVNEQEIIQVDENANMI